jgi:hypothetical protein
MSYLRRRQRTLKDGTIQSYWYRCEAYWENGRSHERVLEYLGVNPNRRVIPLDPALAARVAVAFLEGKPSSTETWVRLKALGIDLPSHPQQVSLTYNPPLRRYSLRCE